MTNTPNPLVAIEQMEAAALRASVVGRQLLAAAADLPLLLALRPLARSYSGEGHAELDFQPVSIADAHLWAARLGVKLVTRLDPAPDYRPGEGDEHVDGCTFIDGVKVHVGTVRFIEPDEWAAIQAAAKKQACERCECSPRCCACDPATPARCSACAPTTTAVQAAETVPAGGDAGAEQ
ncbi:hypothetical protein [Streptomyces niveus]|uniref:hypothetical protein n=1 Tax=Streptomyces niveus TaxID=193462 RepID=UPI0033A0C803